MYYPEGKDVGFFLLRRVATHPPISPLYSPLFVLPRFSLLCSFHLFRFFFVCAFHGTVLLALRTAEKQTGASQTGRCCCLCGPPAVFVPPGSSPLSPPRHRPLYFPLGLLPLFWRRLMPTRPPSGAHSGMCVRRLLVGQYQVSLAAGGGAGVSGADGWLGRGRGRGAVGRAQKS
jgi:hypothetical protein